MAKNIGAKIVLEGADEYRQNIKSINASQKELQSELKLTASEFAGQENSLKALEQKQEIYVEMLDVQNRKLAEYQKMLDSANAEHDKAGDKVAELSEQLAKAQEEYDRMAESGNATTEELKAQSDAIEAISGELDRANEYYQRTGDAVQDWQTKVNNAQTEINNLNTKIEENVGYIAEAKNSTDKIATSIDEYGRKIKDAKEQTSNFGEIMKANLAADAVMAGFENLIDLIKKAGDELVNTGIKTAYLADEINTLSVQTGISTDTIQELQYAEELMDVSVSTITDSMRKNIQSMEKAQDGAEKYADAYKNLGIEIEGADGHLRDSEDVFWDVIDALGRMQDASERDAVAMELFGKKAQALNPLIAQGRDGFQKLATEAHNVGYVLDKETLNGLNKTSDSLERASKYADTLKKRIGAEMAPTIEKAVEKITKKISDNEDEIMDLVEGAIKALTNAIEFLIDHTDEIKAFGEALVVGATAFAGYKIAEKVTGIVEGFKNMLIKATTEQTALNGAMALNPAAAVAAGIMGVATAISFVIKANKDNPFNKIKEDVKELNEEIDKNREEYEKSASKIEVEATKAQDLATKIENLQQKETLSNAEKQKMAQYVAELNKLYPNLNYQIDSQTGKLIGNTKEIYNNIEAQKQQVKLEANKERLNELLEEQIELETQLSDLEEQLAEIMQGTYVDAEGRFHVGADAEEVAILQSAIDDLSTALEDNKAQVDALSDSNYQLESAQESANEQAQLAREYQVQLGDELYKVAGLTEEQGQKLQSLAEEYEKEYQTARTSIENQVTLFEQLNTKAGESKEKLAKNAEENAKTLEQYATNMTLLASAVDEGLLNSGIYEDLKKLGVEGGAGQVAELAKSFEMLEDGTVTFTGNSKEGIENLNEAYAEMQEQIDAVAEVYTNEYKEAVEEAMGLTDENLKAIQEATTTTIETINTTIADSGIADSMEIEMTHAVEVVNNAFGIDGGQSSVFYEIGQAIPASMCEGIESGRQSLVDKMDSVIDSMIEKINSRKADIASAVDRALGDATD